MTASSRSSSQSRAASCNNFCPASETKVVYGSSIDHAATENGKSYSDLPNAFRYRNELVAGCTCNGKDQIGLAPVRIEDWNRLTKSFDGISGAYTDVVTRDDWDTLGMLQQLGAVARQEQREIGDLLCSGEPPRRSARDGRSDDLIGGEAFAFAAPAEMFEPR